MSIEDKLKGLFDKIEKLQIDRLEVIDETGRAYTNCKVEKAEVSIQDNGKTLKIFVK
jgi:hypothetical protein